MTNLRIECELTEPKNILFVLKHSFICKKLIFDDPKCKNLFELKDHLFDI